MLDFNSINNPKPTFLNFTAVKKHVLAISQSILAKFSWFKSVINSNGISSNYLSSLIEIMLDLNTINNPKPAFLTFTAVKKQVLAISKSILAKTSQFKLIINFNSTSSIYLLSLIEVILDFNSINNPKPAFLTFTAVKKQVLAISQSILAKISQFKSIINSNSISSNYLSSLIEIILDLNSINNLKPAFLTFTAVKKQVLAISQSILTKILQFKSIIISNSTSSNYLSSLIEVMLDLNTINN